MQKLIKEIEKCEVCLPFLENGVRPVFSFHPKSKIVIIGQAPGLKVHNTGIPWHDKSGENLRNWMGVDEATFYNPEQIAIVPMGFCYPGRGKSGDLPPRKECAPLWHPQILKMMPDVQLTIMIGQYAQRYYLKEGIEKTLTATVKNFRSYLPDHFVLPHPSPRNNIWQAKNPWFKKEVLSTLQKTIDRILQ